MDGLDTRIIIQASLKQFQHIENDSNGKNFLFRLKSPLWNPIISCPMDYDSKKVYGL